VDWEQLSMIQLTLGRDTSIYKAIAYRYSGDRHYIIFASDQFDRIVANTDSLEEARTAKIGSLQNAFDLPSKAKSRYFELQPLLSKALESEVFSGKKLDELSSTFLRSLSESLPDLITFNSSLVDQLPWERLANIELTDGAEEVECDLFALINEFFCRSIIPLVTGPQFTESYDLLATDLALFNISYYRLALGLPRFFPLPGLPGASLARKRLLQNLTRYFKDLTYPVKRDIPDDESVSGDEETDAETPTPASALNELFSQHEIPLQARAAVTSELLHRLCSKAIPLAFWTILHIYRDSDSTDAKAETPLNSIRMETKTWAEAVQPPSIHPSFPSPPEISFSSLSALFDTSKLTYLRSCIAETKRLYNSRILTAKITKPISITESIRGPQDEVVWELEPGSYLDIGLSERLINTSAWEHVSPDRYMPDQPDRFVRRAPPSATLFDESDALVDPLLLALVAGIAQLWEISAAPKKSFFEQMQEVQAAAAGKEVPKAEGEKKKGTWVVPKTRDGANVLLPKEDIRVRIRRREGLDEKRRAIRGSTS
jgi:hypothetical protein